MNNMIIAFLCGQFTMFIGYLYFIESKPMRRCRDALKPFAAFADALSDKVPDTIAIGIYADGGMRFGPSGGANVGSLRAAKEALHHQSGFAKDWSGKP